MKTILIFILNRLYVLLCKIKNQSPLFGASIWVGLLILVSLGNIELLIYSQRTDYSKMGVVPIVLLLCIIVFFVFKFALTKKTIITKKNGKVPLWQDLLIILLYIFTIVSFVLLANINREKIYAERKAKHPTEQPVKQNSLEGKIRDWWNNRDK